MPDLDEQEVPYVCPGCYALGDERCAEWCPDAEIEQKREWRTDNDDFEDEYLELGGEA